MKKPKVMRELHKIREEMSKMSYEELEKELELVRRKYKNLTVS